MKEQEQHRIDYFDLAKGVGIILVMWFHVQGLYEMQLPTDKYVYLVKLPVFFFLSGYFFKSYGCFAEFAAKKSRGLLIPFLFFYCVTSVLVPIACTRLLGMNFSTGNDWSLVYAFLTYSDYPNIPLWFLWGLFILNIFFYALRIVVRNDFVLLGICVLLTFVLGFAFVLPAQLNMTFEGLGFLCIGYLFKKYEVIDRLEERWAMPLSLLGYAVIGYVDVEYPWSVVVNMAGSVFGVVFLILVCRRVVHLPYVSYVGRYSLIVLATHGPILRILSLLHLNSIVLCFALLLLANLIVIPLMKRCLHNIPSLSYILR